MLRIPTKKGEAYRVGVVIQLASLVNTSEMKQLFHSKTEDTELGTNGGSEREGDRTHQQDNHLIMHRETGDLNLKINNDI